MSGILAIFLFKKATDILSNAYKNNYINIYLNMILAPYAILFEIVIVWHKQLILTSEYDFSMEDFLIKKLLK